jgi:hypothetical protein
MLTIAILSLWLQAAGDAGSQQQDHSLAAVAQTRAAREASDIARCADLFESPDERVKPSLKIAPGAPPLLSFRYFEGKMRQRFSGIDLTLDDAGH